MEKNINKPVIYSLFVGLFVIIAGSFFFMENTGPGDYNYDSDYQYVSKLFDDGNSDSAVVKNSETLLKPFTDANVKIVQNFYDYRGQEAEQENAIINYDQTYIQNNGVAYSGDKSFDVISVLSGTVTKVTEDKLQGKIVEVTHENNIITTYKSLSDVLVKQNDVLKQGTIIGKSGTANINKELGDHVLFEVSINGVYINPESYYGQEINNLKNH